VAYRAGFGVAVVDVDSGRVLARHAARGVRQLAWSPDGRTLAAADSRFVHLWRANGTHLMVRLPGVRALAYSADGRLAVLLRREIVVLFGGEVVQSVFKWPTPLEGLAWSPSGRWLATSIPAADQLVFVGRRGVRAVGNLSAQFGGSVSLDGWAPGA
jgi:WD40 repeat protein